MFPARRAFLKLSLGGLGLSLPTFLTAAETARRGRSCIVLYCWGGMSHHETWDTKPDAPKEYRGEFKPIATAIPGIRIGEHLPRLAEHTDKLAIIRSMHHRSSAHGKGMYWNITGHPLIPAEVPDNVPPSRADWPCLGAMVAPVSPSARPAFRMPCNSPIRSSITIRCKRAITRAFWARRMIRLSCGPIAENLGAASHATSAPWC